MLKFEPFAKDRKRIITIIHLFSNLECPKVRDKIEEKQCKQPRNNKNTCTINI